MITVTHRKRPLVTCLYPDVTLGHTGTSLVGTNGLNQGRKTNLTHCRTLYHKAPIRPTSEKSVFPVQQACTLTASRVAGKSFFFKDYFLRDYFSFKKKKRLFSYRFFFFPFLKRLFSLCIEKVWKKKKNLENIPTKNSQSAL